MAEVKGGQGWQEGGRKNLPRLFSEIIFPDSFTLTTILAIGAFRVTQLERGRLHRSSEWNPPDAALEPQDFVMK